MLVASDFHFVFKRAVTQGYADGDVILTPKDFEIILCKAGVKLSRADIDNIVFHVDLNHNGEVSVDELETAIKRAKLQRRGGVDAMTRIDSMLKGKLIKKSNVMFFFSILVIWLTRESKRRSISNR